MKTKLDPANALNFRICFTENTSVPFTKAGRLILLRKMISVYCKNILNTQIYFVDKMKSLYLLQEVVSRFTVGLLSFKQNK